MATTPIAASIFGIRESRSKNAQESMASSDIGHLLASGVSHHRDREYKGPSDAAQLAPEDVLARDHDSSEHNSLGHKWWPGWRPVAETDIEKLPPEPRRHHRGGHGLGVFQYNCESLRAPDRLYELMAMAKHTGADVACLQGTLFDGFGEWTKHGYHFFSLNRSGPRQEDGRMTAVSTKFPRTQIRCVHHWMPGWSIDLRLQCGVGRDVGNVYFISAYAPVHDERTQTSTSAALRIELWRELDGVIRQVPNRCRVTLSMDANGEVDATLPWIVSAGSRIRDGCKKWT